VFHCSACSVAGQSCRVCPLSGQRIGGFVAASYMEHGSCRLASAGRGTAVSVKMRDGLASQIQAPMVPVVHVADRCRSWRAGFYKLEASGRRGDVTRPSRRGDNPATRLKGGRKPSLFFSSALRLGDEAA
jgi:hypothetical protein